MAEVERIAKGAERGAESVVSTTGELLGGAAEAVERGGKAAAKIAFPTVTWKIALAAIVAMIVLAVVVMRSCSITTPSISPLTPVEALPQPVRAAATCRHADSGGAVNTCTIPSANPLLAGGLMGGRPLTFTVEADRPDQLGAVVRGWRAAGGTAIVDGTVYIAVGPSATVWYADTTTGLRIETATFANRAAARTFLYRSGLIG